MSAEHNWFREVLLRADRKRLMRIKQMTSGFVLTFHGIARGNECSGWSYDSPAARYQISLEIFEQILARISPQSTCTASDLLSKSEASWLVLTFDDGLWSDFEIAAPLLFRFGIRATFFVTAENVGRPGFVTWKQLRQMADAGMEIASHGLTHRYLVNMTREDAIREIHQSKVRIEDALGRSVDSFAPVGGHYRHWMQGAAARIGYRVFATMIPGKTIVRTMHTVLRRNHIQAHHDSDYIQRLLSQEPGILRTNRLKYSVLQLPKTLLGLRTYDRLKNSALTRSHCKSQ